MDFIKKHGSNIIKTLLIAFIIGILTTGTTFYIQSKIDDAISLEKEKIQNNKIYYIQHDIEITHGDIDTLKNQNALEHKILSEKIDNLTVNIKTLTYVISKNNQKMRKELKEIKQIYNENNSNEIYFQANNRYDYIYKKTDD
jgi:hypothetical protein